MHWPQERFVGCCCNHQLHCVLLRYGVLCCAPGTELTHGHNKHDGYRCRSTKGGIAVNYGVHKDDGQHGFTVMLSDVPCTDKDGCPSVNDKGANVTICETRLNNDNGGR